MKRRRIRFRDGKLHFCSISCSRIYQSGEKKRKKLQESKLCERCGKAILRSNKPAYNLAAFWKKLRFCSQTCAQTTRWSKIKVEDRIPRRWRISMQQRTLHRKLGWPGEWLEAKIPIKRISGPFEKGEVYNLMVDLIHPEVKLAIEVDGPTHRGRQQKARDKWKEKKLKSLGWSLLRFSNKEIDTGLSEVVRKVQSTISKLKDSTTSSPPARSSTTAWSGG